MIIEKQIDHFQEEDEFCGLGDDLLSCVKKDSIDLPPKIKKSPRIKKTVRQKAIRVMFKRANITTPPSTKKLFEGKTGHSLKISEIGFLSNDKQSDKCLQELSDKCPIRNRLNRDEISKARVLDVGSQILKSGRMWSPIHLYQDVMGDGRFECISGRHRLAFLALVYGPETIIPVYIETLTLKAAREAVAVANDARPIKALERAFYAIQRTVGGDLGVSQDELYNQMSDLKQNINKYCVYSVVERGYPAKINFKMAEKSSKLNGEVVTVGNIEVFWNEALRWEKYMPRLEFDLLLKDSIKFLNRFIKVVQQLPGFNKNDYLTISVMAALGRYYSTYKNITNDNAIKICDQLAHAVISIDFPNKNQTYVFDKMSKFMLGM